MCRLLETIRYSRDGYDNLFYHTQRMNTSRQQLYGADNVLDLEQMLEKKPLVPDGIVKCRVVLSQTIEKVEYIPYFPRPVRSLQIIYDDTIEYRFKYENREQLQKLFLQRKSSDDIIIVKQGQVTDTSFSNIAFLYKGKWITPAAPLLFGTRRAQLIDEAILEEEEMTVLFIRKCEKARLINSMFRFYESPEIGISQIMGL
ncbi:MAG: aminotransferase class IV [Spirochaetales bacterium]|nr:aminotransferase class IV [Spirochaetales bacterium]